MYGQGPTRDNFLSFRVFLCGMPRKSVVRDRLLLILRDGPMHGYAIVREYYRRYGKTTTPRNIYYHLSRLVEDGLIVAESSDVHGNYSWGESARRVYYRLK